MAADRDTIDGLPATRRVEKLYGLAAALLIAAMSGGCRPTTANSPDGEALRQRDLAIVVSGDTQGWIMPCGCASNQSGGLARRASLLSDLRKSHAVIALDAGGAAESSAPYQLERFRAILDGERLMRVEAHNIGASELALGAEPLRELGAGTGVKFLSCNVRAAEGPPVAEAFLLLEAAGRKLLVTGVVSQEFPAGPGLSVASPIESVLAVLDRVPRPFDKLIVLAWLREPELRRLGELLPEADAVIGGPTGQAIAPHRAGRTLLMSATNKGKFLAKLVLPFSPPNSPFAAELVETSPAIADDPAQLQNLQDFRARLEPRDFTAAESGFLARGSWTPPADQMFAGSASCRACHAAAFDVWSNSGHAHAWDRLRREGAHVDSYCQQCHVTGFGLPGGFVSAGRSPDRVDVGCENCHGPSRAHVERSEVRTPVDAAAGCVRCHDHENSPHFNFAAYWERIQHD